MFTSDLLTNIFALSGIIVLSMLAGYGMRGKQLAKKNRRIRQLEHEMIETHAEILEVQKEFCELESKYKGPKIQLISKASSLGKDRPRTA